ncbi:unnamed protein product [Closterium sp. NIES-64]|nr:unnamed protein product [Closterium sp. NIES-64]
MLISARHADGFQPTAEIAEENRATKAAAAWHAAITRRRASLGGNVGADPRRRSGSFKANSINGAGSIASSCGSSFGSSSMSRSGSTLTSRSSSSSLARSDSVGFGPSRFVLRQRYEDIRLRYLVHKEQLGTGEYGAVRPCVEADSGRLLACKTIRKQQITTYEDAEAIRTEVACLWEVRGHPSIISLHDAVEDGKRVHLVMELCHGGDLFRRVTQRGTLSERSAAKVCHALATAVLHCHRHGIMHRDIKPKNVLLLDDSDEPHVKLSDFGVATFFEDGDSLTEFAGTTQYIAPEVWKGQYGPEADIWGLGALLYFCIAVTDRSSPCKKLSRCLTDDDMSFADDHVQVDSSRPLESSSATRDPLEGGQRTQPVRHDDVSVSVSASRDVSRANAASSDVPGIVQPSRTLPASHDRSQGPSTTSSQPNQRNLQSPMLRKEEPRELQRQWDSLGANATDRACDSVDAEPSNAEAARRRRELRLRVDSEGSEDDADDLRSRRSDRLVPAYSKRQGHHGACSMRAGGKLKWGEDFWRGKPAEEAIPRGFTFKGYLAQPMAAHAVAAPSDPPSEREAAQARPFNVQVQVFRRVVNVMRRVRIPVIHPYSRFRRDVNLLIALCITYNVWEVFYQVAFNLRAQGAWQIVDACLSAIFLADVFLGFKTGYVTKEKHVVMDDGMKVLKPQQIVMDQRKVVWHYLRTWFALDLLSSLPFDLLTSLASDSPAGFWISVAFRLLKLFRVHRLGVAAKQLRRASVNTNYMDVAILLFQICMLCHIGACIFVLIGRLELPDETWLGATYWSEGGVAQTLESAPAGVVYVAAIYWSMVTFAGVGYGDIHPMNTLAERLFATVYILLTAIMLGYTIGELSSMVYARRMQRESMRQRMTTLHRFIEREHLPEWLANRMMAYLMRQWQASVNSKFEELELMQSLTDDLRTDLFVHWWTQHVPPSPFFPHEQQCLATLQRVLVPRAVAAGDVVVREGEVSRHVYVVRAGTLEMAWALHGADTLVETAATLPGKPILGSEGMKLARAVSMRRCRARSMQRQASCSSHGSPMAPPLHPAPATAALHMPTPMHDLHGKNSTNSIGDACNMHGGDASPAPGACEVQHGESPAMVGCSRRTRVYDSSLCTIASSSLMHSDSCGSGDGFPLPGDAIEPLREDAEDGCGEGAGHRGASGVVPRVHSTAASHESYGSVRHNSHLLGQAAFESRTVGVGHVMGLDGLSEVLELQTSEPSWPEQRVPFLFMEGTFQAKTECELLLLLIDDLFDTLESFPELLTVLRLSLGLPLTEQEQLHTNRAPGRRSNRPWRTSSHRIVEHDAATANHAAQRRQSRLDFQTELGSPAERREKSESLNQRMIEGRGDAMDHSSEPRLDTSGSCSPPSSLDVLPVSSLPASALSVSPFDVLQLPVPDDGERPDVDGTSRSGVAGARGGAEGEPLPGGKPLFGQRRLRSRLWRSTKELREEDPGDDVALSFAFDTPPAAAPLKARSPFQWVMKSASGVFAPGGGDDGSSSSGSSSDSGGSIRRTPGKEGAARVALEEYMNVPMQLRPGRSGESEPPDAEQMGARRWWRGGPCVVAFKAALAAAMRVRIPIVHPYSRFRRDVNLIVGACIAYNLWEVLYMVAFDLRATGAWLFLDSCLSLVYLADVLLGFKTGYLTREKHVMGEGGVKMLLPQQIVMDQRRIVWHYLRTWFVVDVLSSLPIDLIISALAQSSIGFWLSAALRLLKLLRLRRLGQATQQLRQSALAGLYMEMTILVLQICMVCHVGACAFALIGRLETAPQSWLAAFNWSNGGAQETLESAPHGVVYAAAYYWAMVTFASVGYGDIHPVDTLAERLFATGYILVTSILLGYAIGQISSLIYSSRARRESVRQRCNTLHRFIEKEEIPEWLANRMMVSLTGKWQSELSQRFHEGDLVDALSDDLRADLFVHWWQRHVLPSPMLPHNHSFLAHVFPCLILRRVAPADVIASEGEFTRHLYIVRSGTLDVTRLKDGPPPALAPTHAVAELAGCEADVDGCGVEMKGGIEEVQLPPEVARALQEHGGALQEHGGALQEHGGAPGGRSGSLGGLLGAAGAGAGVGGLGAGVGVQRRAMGRSLAVQEAVPAVAGAVGYEKESVGEGHVAGMEGLKVALEMRKGEEEWSSQRVSVICMAASFQQAKTECEVYLLLLDDLFDALESFPELLTAMRTALGLPLAPDEYLARPRLMASHRSFKGLQRNKSQTRPTPFSADSSSNKTLSFGKGRVMRVGSSSMLKSFKG